MGKEKMTIKPSDVGSLSFGKNGELAVGQPDGTPRIAEAAMTSVQVRGNKGLARKMELAMAKAIMELQAKGVNDPDKLRDAAHAARIKVRDEHRAAEAEAMRRANEDGPADPRPVDQKA